MWFWIVYENGSPVIMSPMFEDMKEAHDWNKTRESRKGQTLCETVWG